MRKLQLILLFSAVASGCASYTQLYQFTSDSKNVRNANSFLTFEDDAVKIDYSFWAAGGNLSFLIYNKLDKPIYIDWKKSAFVLNNHRFPYFSEDQKTTFKSTGSIAPNLLGGFNEETSGVATVVKEERVTFIPPKSYITKQGFKILEQPLDHSGGTDSILNKKKIIVYHLSKKAPLIRNFLTFATKEDFQNEFQLDNEFYISSVIVLNASQFMGKQISHDYNHPEHAYPYQRADKGFITNLRKKD